MPFAKRASHYRYPMFELFSLEQLVQASGYSWHTLENIRSRSTYQGLVVSPKFRSRMLKALNAMGGNHSEATLFGTEEE
jgi:hypothetical protein